MEWFSSIYTCQDVVRKLTESDFLSVAGNSNAGSISSCISGCISLSNLEGNEYDKSCQFCISGSCPDVIASGS